MTTTEPLCLDPATSLSMTYLRAYARENATQPGKVRLSRKAMHMLRMHWDCCAPDRHDQIGVSA